LSRDLPVFLPFRREGGSRLKAGMTVELEPRAAISFTTAMDSDWQPCVYILARASHSTLYTGVTSSLPARVYQHREALVRGFAQRYGIKRLVWFEAHETMEQAIIREKRIKRWSRAWKYDLIHRENPTWRDLAEDFGFPPLPLK
jgi:putative endonuclease